MSRIEKPAHDLNTYVMFDREDRVVRVGTRIDMLNLGATDDDVCHADNHSELPFYRVNHNEVQRTVAREDLVLYAVTRSQLLLENDDYSHPCECTSQTLWAPAEMCGYCDEEMAYQRNLRDLRTLILG